MSKYGLRFFFFCLIVASLTICASAQGTTARFTGSVEDTNGAAVSGANVILTNEGTNASLTTQTSEGGSYVFDLIPDYDSHSKDRQL